MTHLGRHLFIELYGCCPDRINDTQKVRASMLAAATLARATIVTDVFHQFNPHGISGVVVIAESHLAIHTWPEHSCASVDVFSCGDTMRPELVAEFLKKEFAAKSVEVKEHARGKVKELQPAMAEALF